LDFLSEANLEQEVLKGVARVEAWDVQSESTIPWDKLKKASAILLWHLVHLGKESIDKFSSDVTKLIVRVGVGFDSVDLRAAGEKGIYVANVPDYGVEEVADSAISLLLNLMRKTHELANGAAAGTWPTQDAKGSTRVRGKKLGIIGLGKIGKAVAVRAKVFGLEVYYYDPYLEDGLDKSLGLTRIETLKELLSTMDVISVNCDLNKDNHHLLNQETLGWIPSGKGVYLVNTARGGLIDEKALLSALSDGRVKAAALDVLENEPYTDGHLNDIPNLLLTPHTAFYSDESFAELRTKAALEVKRVLQGQPPRNCVNKQFM